MKDTTTRPPGWDEADHRLAASLDARGDHLRQEPEIAFEDRVARRGASRLGAGLEPISIRPASRDLSRSWLGALAAAVIALAAGAWLLLAPARTPHAPTSERRITALEQELETWLNSPPPPELEDAGPIVALQEDLDALESRLGERWAVDPTLFDQEPM